MTVIVPRYKVKIRTKHNLVFIVIQFLTFGCKNILLITQQPLYANVLCQIVPYSCYSEMESSRFKSRYTWFTLSHTLSTFYGKLVRYAAENQN